MTVLDEFGDARGYDEGLSAERLAALRQELPSDWPTHQPECFDAPIPGRQWYGGCDPDRPRVDPSGRCTSCGGHACAECGRENCPDHGDHR